MTREEMLALADSGIRGSMKNICGTMLGCDVEVGSMREIAQPLQESEGVVALVGMAGPWIGTGALTCRREVACRLAGAFLMAEYDEVNEEVLDAFAELANMVIGNLKTLIEEEVGPMGLSTPTTIYGASFTTKIGGANAWTLIPVKICGGELLIQLCLLPNQEGRVGHKVDVVGHMITRA